MVLEWVDASNIATHIYLVFLEFVGEYNMMNQWIEREVSISEIKSLLADDYEIDVSSPDGFVPVTLYVEKGSWDEYVLLLGNGKTVRCNENHLFETTLGWKSSLDLSLLPEHHYLTESGYVKGRCVKTDNKIQIVDINVDHPNHRYYTNGISSHNTNVGKSLAMCHMAAGSLSAGYNVLYLTLEMSEERIAERIDANLLNLDLDTLKKISKADYERKFTAVKSRLQGKLIIKEYPTASASTLHFRALLNELQLKKNFHPDIIFVDYINICTSARVKPGANINSYTYVKSIAEELRGLAVEFDVPIMSATQTTRGGFANSDPDLTDTSESFGLPATADFMVALIVTEELQQLNQMMVKQLKNRYGDLSLNKRFVIGVDRAKMKLYDVEASAQQLSDSGQTEDLHESGGGSKFNRYSGLIV